MLLVSLECSSRIAVHIYGNYYHLSLKWSFGGILSGVILRMSPPHLWWLAYWRNMTYVTVGRLRLLVWLMICQCIDEVLQCSTEDSDNPNCFRSMCPAGGHSMLSFDNYVVLWRLCSALALGVAGLLSVLPLIRYYCPIPRCLAFKI
jgi:hypothetical protein